MSRRRECLLKALLSLFALNSITLYIYFSSHHNHLHWQPRTDDRHILSENRKALPVSSHNTQFSLTSRAKPWPILPSYLPWSLNPNVTFRSCEGYFGNGFTRREDILPSSVKIPLNSRVAGNYGWFRCFYSETLRSSICEGGRVRMNPEKIRMSSGGERLEDVIGRREEEELPEFELGAFNVDGGEGFAGVKKLVSEEFLDQFVPEGEILKHTMRSLLDSVQVVGERDFQCSEVTSDALPLVL